MSIFGPKMVILQSTFFAKYWQWRLYNSPFRKRSGQHFDNRSILPSRGVVLTFIYLPMYIFKSVMTFLFVMIVTRPCFSNSINSGGGAKKESPRSLPQASYFQHTHTNNRGSSRIAPLNVICVRSEVFLGWIRNFFLSPLRPPPPEIPWGT